MEPVSGCRSFWKLRPIVIFKAAGPAPLLCLPLPPAHGAAARAVLGPAAAAPGAEPGQGGGLPPPVSPPAAGLWLWWALTWASRAAISPWRGPAASRPSPTSSATGARRE